MLRLALHFNNYASLGHATVIFSLVKSLKRRFNNKIRIIVIEEGSAETNVFPFEKYARAYFSPSHIPDFRHCGSVKDRAVYLRKILGKFKPDIFITDYFPFNRDLSQREVFVYILGFLKRSFNTKLVSSCNCLNCSEKTFDLIKSFYDMVIFHFPKSLFYRQKDRLCAHDRSAMDKILRAFSAKIYFSGFLLDELSDASHPSCAQLKKGLALGVNKKLIVVSRGGRSEYDGLIVDSISLARRHRDWFFAISAGSSMSAERYMGLRKASGGMDNVRLSRIIYPHFDRYLSSADLSINMSGYNTMVRLLYFNKKTIISPVANTDQALNARLLKSLLNCRIIGKDAGPLLLESRIGSLLSEKDAPPGAVDPQWFEGLGETVNIIKTVFGS